MKVDPKSPQMTLRLDPELKVRLTAAAEARAVSLTYLVNKLLSEAIERLIPPDEVAWTRVAALTEEGE